MVGGMYDFVGGATAELVSGTPNFVNKFANAMPSVSADISQGVAVQAVGQSQSADRGIA